MSSYLIIKGISRPITFKGLEGRYIWWFAGIILGMLILFAVLFIAGLNEWICMAVVGSAGATAGVWTFRISQRYGEHGLLKKRAAGSIPRALRCRSRAVFMRSV